MNEYLESVFKSEIKKRTLNRVPVFRVHTYNDFSFAHYVANQWKLRNEEGHEDLGRLIMKDYVEGGFNMRANILRDAIVYFKKDHRRCLQCARAHLNEQESHGISFGQSVYQKISRIVRLEGYDVYMIPPLVRRAKDSLWNLFSLDRSSVSKIDSQLEELDRELYKAHLKMESPENYRWLLSLKKRIDRANADGNQFEVDYLNREIDSLLDHDEFTDEFIESEEKFVPVIGIRNDKRFTY